MAIVQNFWLKGAKKRLAGAVIYQAGGQTIQRSLAGTVSNPQTQSQMSQRVKWANLVSFYRANRGWMRYAYETKRANQSEYNKMMSLNVTNSRIYLTKQAAAAGACVVDGYVMTQGTLPSITYNRVGQSILTNIYLYDVSGLDETSSIADLSAQILGANPGLREGDQLSIIRYTQMVNEQTGYPYVIVRKYELVLSLTSTDLWANYWPASLVDFTTVNEQHLIAITPTGNAGGLLMVLSRTISGKTYVSSQTILPVDNSAIINAYSSAAALNAAIQSYGVGEDAFLSSVNANYAELEPIALVPLSVNVGQVQYVANDITEPLSGWEGKRISVNFNREFDEEVTAFYVDTYSAGNTGTAQQQSVSVSGNSVIVPSCDHGTVDLSYWVRQIRIVTADNVYSIAFSEGGLE